MSTSNKTPSMQIYRLALYQRALHPELFKIQARKTLTQAEYEVEAWILQAGHTLRFQVADDCLTEAVAHQDFPLPDRHQLQNLQCMGEREVDQTIDGKIRYVASAQTELLSDNLFTATYNEMKDFAKTHNAIEFEWRDPDGSVGLSVLDIQLFRREVHAQSYHMLGASGFMLRTQSIFELIRNPSKDSPN